MAEETTSVKRRVFLSWEDDFGQSIIFDATISEDHEARSEPTDHPVESGSDLTDHIRRMPEELQLMGIVTDDPIVVDRTTIEAASTGGDPNRRAKSAYDWLLQTKDQARLLTVFTRLRTYRNMAITAMTIKRTKDDSRIIRVALTLREIMIAVTEQVDAPVPAKKAAPARRNKRGKGKRSKQKETEANKKVNRSLASKFAGDSLTDALAGGPGNLQGI